MSRSMPALRQGAETERDLTDWQALLREAYEACCTNPLACAVVEQQTNFIPGRGWQTIW